MRMLPCGESGLLLELTELAQVQTWYAALAADPPAGVVDLVPAARTVLIVFDPELTTPSRVAEQVTGLEPAPGLTPVADRVTIPVRYDGDDLAEVGRRTGLGARGVVAAHTSAEWTVAFCGFSPGFGYLVGTDTGLRVPRREVPRTRVLAGAVALADEFTGVYPRQSPGGWQLIGRTELRVWDLDRSPPAILRPGVRVRFVEVA